MKIVTGRFAEVRLYLRYAASPLRPGIEVPTFREPREFKWKIDSELLPEDLSVIVDEGRRQIDRQLSDLEKVRSRAGALLTLCLAEVAALSAGASRVFTHSYLIPIWVLSVGSALLSTGGAIALLTAQAQFGRIDTMGIALVPTQVRRVAALSYAKAVGIGEETIATRITVLRDGVLLAILAALLYAAVWPAAVLSAGNDGTTPSPRTSSAPSGAAIYVIVPSPAVNGGTPCPTCTPSSALSSSTKPASPRMSAPNPPLDSQNP
jgi:hypothetical protein